MNLKRILLVRKERRWGCSDWMSGEWREEIFFLLMEKNREEKDGYDGDWRKEMFCDRKEKMRENVDWMDVLVFFDGEYENERRWEKKRGRKEKRKKKKYVCCWYML